MKATNLLNFINKKGFKSFSLTVYFYLCVGLLLLTGLLTFVSVYFQQIDLKKEIIRDGTLLSQAGANAARLGFFAADDDMLDTALKSILDIQGALVACAVDNNLQLLVKRTKNPETGIQAYCLADRGDNPKKNRLLQQLLENKNSTYLEEKGSIEFWAPVRLTASSYSQENLYFTEEISKKGNNSIIGYLGLTMDKSHLKQKSYEIITRNSVILFFFLLAGTIVNYLIVRAATIPLTQLAGKISSANPEIEFHNEVDMIATTYDRLILNLHGSFETINGLKADLEAKVKQLKTEIDNRIQVEKALKNSEQTARTLLNVPGQLAALFNRQGMIIDANELLAKTLNRKLSELINENLWDILPDDEETFMLKNKASNVSASNRTISLEHTLGNRHYLSVLAQVGGGQQDGPGMVAILSQDITERKRMELKLHTSEKQYRSLVETIQDVVYTLDVEGLITYISPRVQEVLGYSPAEMIGTSVFSYIRQDRQADAAQKFMTAVQGVLPASTEVPFISKTAKELTIELNGAPLLDIKGKPMGRIGTARDISLRRLREREHQEILVKALAQAELASLGQVATGMAHEINQPLSYIRVIYESTLLDIESENLDAEELRGDFQEALRQVERISKIINHLRSFGRAETLDHDLLSLPEVFDKSMVLMAAKIKMKNIKLKKSIEDGLPLVPGNDNKLEQVFINLLENAISAVENQDDASIDLTFRTATGSVQVLFSDNGPGVPPQLLTKIFEPFFTTKEVGEGTGLGLAIAYGIIKDHHGTIECQSELENGTTFIVSLPTASENEQKK